MMDRRILCSIVCLAVIGSASAFFDETMFQKWSDKYTHLEGLDLFEPQIRVGGGRSQQCQPCVEEATEFTLRKALQEFAEKCQQAQNPRLQRVCEVARQDKKFALGMLLEKLNPVKLAFAYCAGRQSCNEEQSERVRNQELSEIFQINLAQILEEVQGQTSNQYRRIPQFNVEVFEGMTPLIEEMRRTLLKRTPVQFEHVNQHEILEECRHETPQNIFRKYQQKYNRYDPEDVVREDQYERVEIEEPYGPEDMDYSRRYNKKFDGPEDMDYSRRYNKKFDQKYQQKKYDQQYNRRFQKYEDEMDFPMRHGNEYRRELSTRRPSRMGSCECRTCIAKADINVMKKVAYGVKQLCEQADTPQTRRFCEVAQQQPEIAIGYLVSKVEPWKYAVGYCRALDMCEEMGVESGRREIVLA